MHDVMTVTVHSFCYEGAKFLRHDAELILLILPLICFFTCMFHPERCLRKAKLHLNYLMGDWHGIE
jgi:hypothetical protein